MGRISKTFCLLIFCIGILKSQCPDLPNNTTVDGSSATNIELCGPNSVLFEVNDPLLPSGVIEWSNVNTGELLGTSAIDSADPCDAGGCPAIEVIYIDACGPGSEALNEFMVISSGAGFQVDDLAVMFDVNNTFGGAGNQNINDGASLCNWIDGDLSLFSGCTSLIAAGSGDYIPPNSAVIIQTSNFGTTTYNLSSLCGVSECVYVIRNSCDRNVGAFSNCGAGTGMGSTRTNEITLTCGCSDVLIYDILDPNFLDVCNNIGPNGMYVTGDLTYANDLCDNGPSLGSISQFSYTAVTDPFNYSFTDDDCNTIQNIIGILNSSQYNTDCCSGQVTDVYTFEIDCVEAELQGNADLCPGECAEIDVLISGGDSPYDLDLTISGLPFPFNNITLPFTGFPIDEKITVCFDNGGPLIDEDNFTVDVPAVAAGISGTLSLNTIEDANGCMGTVISSSISLSFNDEPDIVNPGEQEACDLGDGTGIFNLSDLNAVINGGTGATVNFYSDMDGTMSVVDPYITSGGSIFAQVEGTPCNSEIIEIPLTVISNGNAGLVSLFCNDPNTGPMSECNICDEDGVLGEDISLTIIFEDPFLTYEYEVLWSTESGASSSIMGSAMGTADFNFMVEESMTFVVTVVTAEGDCPDITDLGDIVTINYSLQPDVDEPQNISECGSVTLPDITGNIIPANSGYYTEPGGMGTMYNPGDIISDNTTLYLYAGIQDCDVDFSFDITIEDQAIIDEPEDVVSCGVYALPEITGTNVDNVSYYTEIDGGGNMISEGTIISTSTTLYLYDSNCGGNQPVFNITITPGPVIGNNTDTIVCELYIVEPIVGIDLSGNEAYYDTTNGNGNLISIGDSIMMDSILFIYDNTGGCEVEVPIFIDIKEPTYPGLDTAIIVCEGDPTFVNMNEALGGELPDSTGIWFDVNATGVVMDSSQVDFSPLGTGVYLFEYQITDSICVDTHSVLTVTIIGTPNAGSNASITICSDTSGVNVFSLLGNPDNSGTFYDDMNTVVSFDPENADFSASVSGTTIFTYVVGDPVSSCGADSATFTVLVEESVYAGDDVSDAVCAGNLVALQTLLTNNTSIGLFEEPTVSGGLIGSSFDTEEVEDGTYLIYHILPGNGSCPPDTSTLTITVTEAANAGNENEVELCGETSLSLTDYINGDEGGQYYFNNLALPSGDITFSNEVGTFNYLYIVGDGVECPFDTAVITVVRNLKPATFLDIDITDLCNDDCTTVSFNAANNGGQSILLYYHVESNVGEVLNSTQLIGDLMPDVEITFCVGIGDLSNNELQPGTEYTFVIDSVSVNNTTCTFFDGASVVFNTFVSVESDLTGTYCLDAEVPVGDDIYNESMATGTTIIEGGGQNGCDSIINVDLVFQAVAEGTFMQDLCEGDSITVNNVVYTETNTTDEFIIPNGSINGCDSLVKINVLFSESTFGSYNEVICSGDTIVVNNEPFYSGKEMGSQILEGVNSVGCDSIIDISIEIDDPVASSFSGDYCSTYSIDINGTIYDQNNATGIEIFNNQASNGCDSIVSIDLTFNAQQVDSTLVVSTCDNTFSILVGSTTYDINTPSGISNLESTSPEACDTMVVVDIQFGELGIDYTEVDGGCEATQSGTVIIESSNGDAPFNILYNGNNIIASVLPISIDLPVGSGEISITDASGCESILPYELFPGGDEEFEINESQGQLIIEGGEIDSVLWSPEEGLSCIDCIDPIANPETTTTYSVLIFFGDSCSVNLQIQIEVIDDTPDYILPSVFSPNRDNMNDNFLLTITTGAIGIPQNMAVFNRWGNKVYEGFGTDITTIGWDGMLNGKDVQPGVYVYHFTVLENERLVTIYGDVTVVR